MATVRRLHRQVTGVEEEVERRVAERDGPILAELASLKERLAAALGELEAVRTERDLLQDKVPALKKHIGKLEGRLGDEQSAHMSTREEYLGFQHTTRAKQHQLEEKIKDQSAELEYAAQEKAMLQATVQGLEDKLMAESQRVLGLKDQLRDTSNRLESEQDAHTREVLSLSKRLEAVQEEMQGEMAAANRKMSQMQRGFEAEKHELVLALERGKLENAKNIMLKDEEIAELQKEHTAQVAALQKVIKELKGTVAVRDAEIARMLKKHAAAVALLETQLTNAIEARNLAMQETERLKELLDSQLGRGHSWQNTQRWVREEMGLPH